MIKIQITDSLSIEGTPAVARLLSKKIMMSRPGRFEHRNVKGAISIRSVDLQNTFKEVFREASDYFFKCVSHDFWHARTKKDKASYTKAYVVRDTAYEVLKAMLLDDPGILHKLPKSYKKSYPEYTNLPLCREWLAEGSTFDWHNGNDRLAVELIIASSDANGMALVTYSSVDPDGRPYANGPSHQYLPKYIRNQICSKPFTEVDQDNSHQRILAAFASKQEPLEDWGLIEDYINNRQFYINHLIGWYGVDRKASKTLPIALGYGMAVTEFKGWGGEMEKWMQDNGSTVKTEIVNGAETYIHSEFVRNYSKITRAAGKAMLSHPAFAEYAEIPKQATAQALALQNVETRISDFAEAFFAHNEKVTSVRMHDGLHILGSVTSDEIRSLEIAVGHMLYNKYGIDCDMKFSRTLREPVEVAQ